MSMPYLLALALVQPSPATAPWGCTDVVNWVGSTVTASRYLTEGGKPASDFIAWNGRTGHVLSSVSYAFPERQALSRQAEVAWVGVTERAADYRSLCGPRGVRVSAPPAGRP